MAASPFLVMTGSAPDPTGNDLRPILNPTYSWQIEVMKRFAQGVHGVRTEDWRRNGESGTGSTSGSPT